MLLCGIRLVQIEWFNVNQIPSARWHKVERLIAVKIPVRVLQDNSRVCGCFGYCGAQSQLKSYILVALRFSLGFV